MHASGWIIVDNLASIILDNVKGCIVEIGMGGSTGVLLKHASKHKRTLISCDVDNVKCSRHNHEVHNMTSEVFFSTIEIPTIAISFVDGDHRYRAAKIDIDESLSRLSRGGVIFVHDTTLYSRPYCDQHKYIKELKERDDVQVFDWPYTASNCGLTMIMKSDIRPFLRR